MYPGFMTFDAAREVIGTVVDHRSVTSNGIKVINNSYKSS